jgi:glutaredoxin 3
MGLEWLEFERLELPSAAPIYDNTYSQQVPEPAMSDTPLPQITIYSTAVCPYCVMAKTFLKNKGYDWVDIRIDTNPAEREKMVALARRTSVPQIFVGDVHVGGYDDMIALHREGKLEPLLAGKPA